MDAYERSEEEQHAPAWNLEVYANETGDHQTVESADRERSFPAESRDLATASPSSLRPSQQSSTAPIEFQSTRLARVNEPPADSFWGIRNPESFEVLFPKNIVDAHLAKPYDPLDTTRFDQLAKEIPDSEEESTDDSDLEFLWPTHTPQNEHFNSKGRLPRDAPCFVDMEEPATQPATQPFRDPRRDGPKSMLSEEDECDVLCILHPTSPNAYRAVQLVADYTPQHILQNKNLSHKSKDGSGSVTESSTKSGTTSLRGSMQSASEGDECAMDIALRLTSKLNDPCLGFTFGRGQARSDILIGTPEEVRISTSHFRIYVNQSGIVMLEDTSKNGTLVDTTYLCAKCEKPTTEKRRMLNSGTMVAVILDPNKPNLEDSMRFIVKIPSRNRVEDRWHDKLQNYIEYINQTERQRAARAESSQNGAPTAILSPTNPLGASARQDSTALMAGRKMNAYNIEWNGGEKYNVLGRIGQGAFAVVFQIATKRDGDLYAVKQIEKRKFVKNGVLDKKIKNEMDIMQDLEHPHIVKFIGHEETSRHLLLIMELVPLGDLSRYVARDGAMPEFSCQRVAWQICSALEYLHQRNITHRDIKPENILIECREPLNVKLSDFGLSKRITNDDAFLQTFCGTILYCAPEIYPGYDQYKSGKVGKRRRPNDPPLKTIPYQQSVDIWALAAVLYHLLCACPPYEGTSQNQGAAMLHTVMNNEVDFGKLRSAGVSNEGIDFVSGMLKHDPLARATEGDCLQHPWIAWMTSRKPHDLEMEGTMSPGAIQHDQDEPDSSQLSQLSLTGNLRAYEIMDSDMEYETDVDETADTRQSKRFKSSGEVHGGKQRMLAGDDITYPTLPDGRVGSGLSPSKQRQKQATGTTRLFGEIGTSALRSSADLGYDARAALDMPYQESRDRTATAKPIPTHSLAMKERHVSTITTATATATTATMAPTDDALAQPPPPLQHPQAGSAPSLLGAEAMVGQLNVASPELPPSTPSPTTTATMDKSPPLSESAAAGSQRSSQVFPSTDESTPKRAKLNRPSGTESSSSAQRPQDSAHANVHANPNSTAASTAHEAAENAALPPPRPPQGILTSMPGSVVDTTIKLEERSTFYGRDPTSHYRYMDMMDVRVPKNALDIIWWRPGLEAMVAEGKDWRDVEGLFALVHTRTSIHIRVNGVKLTKGKDCWNYGRLHTGDIITVFGPDEGDEPKGKLAEFLKFRCEFFVGPSATPRTEPFVVEQEHEKFLQHQLNRSRQQSRANSDGVDSQGSQGSGAGKKRTAEQANSSADAHRRDVATVPEASKAGGHAKLNTSKTRTSKRG